MRKEPAPSSVRSQSGAETFVGTESAATTSEAMVSEVRAEIRRQESRRRRRRQAMFALAWVVPVALLTWQLRESGQLDSEWAARWSPFIIQGATITVLVSILGILLATFLAIIAAVGRLSKNPLFAGIASLYVSLVRGTPLLVQIYFVFFALPQVGIVMPPIQAGVIALGFNRGAYMTEIFRAGLQAVPKGQHEAALSLGMRGRAVFRRIVFPQAFRIVLPAVGNEFIGLIKDSALVSTISVTEMLWRARRAGTQDFKMLQALTIAAIVYWLLAIAFSELQRRLERRLARSG